jgi:hypothetical protein
MRDRCQGLQPHGSEQPWPGKTINGSLGPTVNVCSWPIADGVERPLPTHTGRLQGVGARAPRAVGADGLKACVPFCGYMRPFFSVGRSVRLTAPSKVDRPNFSSYTRSCCLSLRFLHKNPWLNNSSSNSSHALGTWRVQRTGYPTLRF